MVKHGQLIAQPGFNFLHGSFTLMMYPHLNIFLMVALNHLLGNPITAIGLFLILQTTLGLVISYYSSYSFEHNWQLSYLFAILYIFSNYLFILYFGDFDLGAQAAYIYLPLVLFGGLNFLKNGAWVELSSGFSLLILSHILTAVFTCGLLILLAILNWRTIKKYWLNLSKVFCLTVCTTSIVWIPFISGIIESQQHFIKPAPSPLQGTALTDSLHITSQTLMPLHLTTGLYTISIPAIFGLFMLCFAWYKFAWPLRELNLIAVLIILGCSNWVPWSTFAKVIPQLNLIQKLYRFYMFPQLIFSFTFAYVIIKMWHWRTVGLIIFSALAVGCLTWKVADNVQSQAHLPLLTSRYLAKHPQDTMNRPQRYRVNTKHQVQALCQWPSYKEDYYPTALDPDLKAQDQVTGNQIQTNRENTVLHAAGENQFAFRLKHPARTLRLPLVKYTKEPLQIKLDHHVIPSQSDSGLILLQHLKAGQHTITFNYRPNPLIKISMMILLGLALIIYGLELACICGL